MNWKQIIPLILTAVILTACSNSTEPQVVEVTRVVTDTVVEVVDGAAPAEESVAFSNSYEDVQKTESLNTQSDIPQERLIIRTADLSIVVSDTEAVMKTIARMVEENGGWVVSSSAYQYSDTAVSGDMTVRVPADGFTSALEAMRGLALEVQSESTSGQDVTEEYVDLSSRLENLESTAVRVRAFLDETRNVEEALAVNQELSRLEGEIEVIKGRMQYLSQSAAFSTISVHLTPDEAARPIELAGWKPEGIVKDAFEALISFLQFLVSALIWVIIFLLPVLIVLGIPLWLVVRFVVRKRRRRKAVNSGQ